MSDGEGGFILEGGFDNVNLNSTVLPNKGDCRNKL